VTLVTKHAALSDIGLHRQTNEDSFVAAPPLFVVCDGMGGAEAGEVASSLAVETLAARFAAGATLAAAAAAANEAVFARASTRVEESGMGTTLTAVVVKEEEGRFVHVGDSRAYRLRDGHLELLSDDHSLVGEMVREGRLTWEEAAVHPHRSILSRVLGTEPAVAIDEFSVDLRAGDVLLLCSDGLSGEVAGDDIQELLATGSPEEAARGLVDAARAAGGHDNITAVVIRLSSADDTGSTDPEADTQVLALPIDAGRLGADDEPLVGGEPAVGGKTMPDGRPSAAGEPSAPDASASAVASSSRSARRRLTVLVVVLALVALLGVAGVVIVNTCYFVGVADGRLAVFSGLPWSVGGLELHSVYLLSARSYVMLDAQQRALVDARSVRTRGSALRLAGDLGMLP